MPDETRDRRARKKTVQQMVVVGAFASALGIALGLLIDWFPAADSTQADKIDTLWDLLVIVSVPVFVLVSVVVIFAVLEFRMKPGEERLDGPPVHGNTRLEVIWTALPAIVLVSLCTYAFIVLSDIEKAPADTRERVVKVTGQQFTWTFEYNEGGKRFTSARLFLPAGESVKFDVVSKDVIHDFWIPDFRMKVDAVPGITTNYRVTPKDPEALGDHDIVCAELCGLGHAYMRQTARIVSADEFAAWVSEMTAPPAEGDGDGEPLTAADAKVIFTDGTQAGASACGACHALADAGTTGGTGPDLDQVLAGMTVAQVKEAIVNPEAEIASGFQGGIMPSNYGQALSAAQIDALAEYLVQVTN